jgi:hypothetical protein
MPNPRLSRNDISFGLALYYGQLGLNVLWSPLFFGQKNVSLSLPIDRASRLTESVWPQIGLALIDCVLLTGATYCMTVSVLVADKSSLISNITTERVRCTHARSDDMVPLTVLRVVDVRHLSEWRYLVVES